MKGYNKCAWLTVGKKRLAERAAAEITAKSTWQRFEKIDPFRFPVGCVVKGLKMRFKSAVLVRWFAFHRASTVRRKKENDRLTTQNNYLDYVLEQQTYYVDEYKLCEKSVKSVIKKLIEKYRDHEDLLEDLRPITEMYPYDFENNSATLDAS